MRLERLDNIAQIIAGQSPPSETYNTNGEGLPFFQGKADFGEMFPKVRYWCKEPTKIALPNDILISVRAPVGPVNICNVESCIGRGLSAIRVNNEYSTEYIYYFLKTNEEQISRLGVGSTFTAITQKEIRELIIPIPETYEEQIRIAKLLGKAEILIKQRKTNIDLLNDILTSTFLKLFFPFFNKSNPVRLESLCDKITDGTHDTPERIKEGIKFITGKHIRPYVIDFENSDYVTEEVHREIYRRCNPEYGDILYTNIGVNLGTAAMNTVDYEFSMKNVALLKLDTSKITSRYLEHLLNLPSRRNRILEMNSSGGAQQFLSLGQIKRIDIPVPPIELQKEFSGIVEKSEILKLQFRSSLIELENLYGSLSQKAFKGELDLSKLVIDESLLPKEVKSEKQTEIINPGILKALDAANSITKHFEKTNELAKAANRFNKYFEQWEKLTAPLNKLPKLPTEFIEAQQRIEKIQAAFANVKPFKPKKSEKVLWEKVSTQQVSNWIKENYSGYHFTSEMLIRFLIEEHVTFPDYYSSEELKKYPQTNEADDLKSLIFSAVSQQNPYLKLEQIFYNAEDENVQLKITEEDYTLIKERSAKNRSGIYFTIIE